MQRFPKLTAFLAGVIAATGFAPLNLWPAALLAIACWIVLVGGAATRTRAAALGWWFGVGHFVLGLNWIAGAFRFQDAMPVWLGWVAVVVLSLYLALFTGLAAALAWSQNANTLPLTLRLAAAWTITEYLRGTLFSGFPWNPLGVMLLPAGALAHLAALIGTYGLSAIAIIIAGAIVLGFKRRWRTSLAILGPAAIAAVIPPLLLSSPVSNAQWPLLRIVQPNISQAQRHDSRYDEAGVQALERLTGPPGTEPRLILWPEAAVPFFLEDEHWITARLAKLLGPGDLLFTGGDSWVRNAAGEYIGARNALFVMDAQGTLLSRYDKAHLVPYGEYLPMRGLLSTIGLSRLVPGDIDYWPGPGPRTLALPGFGAVGIQICYEIVFSGQVVDEAHRPNFIFNPSTDAWFGSWGPPQHLAQARLRAIEEGLPVVRATPTGISAVIDADGQVRTALPLDKPGYLNTRLPPPHVPTLFATFGNILPMIFALILALAGVALQRRGR